MKDKRSYADRPRYNIDAVAKRRKMVRQRAIDYLGGKCLLCGYSRCQSALDFHHVNGEEKSFGISSKGYTRSWEAVERELRKCVLICANCHREVHAGLTQLPSVTMVENKVN